MRDFLTVYPRRSDITALQHTPHPQLLAHPLGFNALPLSPFPALRPMQASGMPKQSQHQGQGDEKPVGHEIDGVENRQQ
jgi:hypothetical protein